MYVCTNDCDDTPTKQMVGAVTLSLYFECMVFRIVGERDGAIMMCRKEELRY